MQVLKLDRFEALPRLSSQSFMNYSFALVLFFTVLALMSLGLVFIKACYVSSARACDREVDGTAQPRTSAPSNQRAARR